MKTIIFFILIVFTTNMLSADEFLTYLESAYTSNPILNASRENSVDTVRENQLFLGRDKSYNIESYGSNFGSSVSIIVDCHLTRTDRVGVTKAR